MYLEPFRSKRGVHFHTSSSQRDGVLCSNSEGCASIDLGRKIIYFNNYVLCDKSSKCKIKVVCISHHIGPNHYIGM